MSLVVGVDIAKEFHWAAVVSAGSGDVLLSRRVDNGPEEVEGFLAELSALVAEHGEAVVGIDVMGGIAALFTAMALEAGLRVVHIPGLAVNRARQAVKGGEHKSDPRDAEVIAGQLRLRGDWRPVDGEDPVVVDLRLLAVRRRELVVEQTQRQARLRNTLVGLFPGLERAVDVTNATDLRLLAEWNTPAQIRDAGGAALADGLVRLGAKRPYAQKLAEKAVRAALVQRVAVAGQERMAQFAREGAQDALVARGRIAAMDAQIAEALERSPDAALIRSLPGMGAVLTAELIAVAGDFSRFPTSAALASAAGLAPVLRQSGKSSYLRRPAAGDKRLKFVFYQSAFTALPRDPISRAFYQRKRDEGKRHHQALIALARRRVDVVHAMLRNRQPYQPGGPISHAA